MKITQVEIQNIRGIADLTFAPNTLTVISGQNGTGKSSVVDALKALVARGHDPDLLRKGAESGHVSVIFDDGQSLTLTVSAPTAKHPAGETKRVVRDPHNRTISSPQSVIDQMTSAVSFDPLSFLDAKESDQLKLLLEALPIRITSAELKAAQIPFVKGVNLDAHGLVVLAELHKTFYDERRDLNRDARKKRDTIAELSKDLPEPGPDAEVALGVAETELNSLLTDRAEALQGIQAAESDSRHVYEASFTEAKAKVERELQEAIDLLRATAEADLESLRRADLRQANALRDRYTAEREAVETRLGQQIETKRETVGTLKAKASEAQRAEGQRQAIAKMQKDADVLELELEGLQASLIAVENLKRTLTSNLPIPGLEITDGRLAIDGIPLSTVNSADKILGVAVEIGMLKMKANGLSFMVIDNGERLDTAHRATLKQIAEAKGIQVVLSTVTDEPELRIG